MADQPIGYSIGILEGYLGSLVKSGMQGAEVCLEHLQNIEKQYREKVEECMVQEEKLRNISLNLDGWKKI
jgi:hypothetical protein